jgi:ribosomal protein L37AE/L43A
MVVHPFEDGPRPDPEEKSEAEARPLPCPECESTKGYSRVGNFRVQCRNCNAVIKNEEVDMQLPNKESK